MLDGVKDDAWKIGGATSSTQKVNDPIEIQNMQRARKPIETEAQIWKIQLDLRNNAWIWYKNGAGLLGNAVK